MQRTQCVFLGLCAIVLAACSAGPSGPHAGMRGYGTPGVESYVSTDQARDLQAQLHACRDVPLEGAAAQTKGLPAACGQLQRTVRNQPGNAVRR